MAHSHDKTLLARLGFQDPDAKDPLHDLACEYMALEENVLKLQNLLVPIASDVPKSTGDNRITIKSNVEVPITKGDGRFRTIVGFADVVSDWVYQVKLFESPEEWTSVRMGVIVTEVKISAISLGDVMRQMGLYREYLGRDNAHGFNMGTKYVVAAAFDVNEYYRSALEREGITIVRLGERFGVWATEKANSASAKIPQF